MPPRPRFSPDRISGAALDLVRAHGVEALTARNLAAALGCSTGPLFTHFSTMDELLQAVLDRAMAEFVDRASEPAHADPVLAAGLGWLGFAADEPRLYEALFLRHHPWHHKWGPIRRRLAEGMAGHPPYADLDSAARFALVGRASVVLHGLGLEIWSGRLRADDPASRLALLEELVMPVVDAAIAQGWSRDFHSLSAGRRSPLSRTA